jgi:2-keto-myo-inositol isomerase
MLLGWNGATTPKVDLAADIEIARQAGFSLIELNAAKLKEYLEQNSTAELSELLQTAKVRPFSIASIDRVTYAGDLWERMERDYRQLSRIAGEIGCEMLIVGPGQRPAGATDSEVKEETVSVLEALADVASGDGIKLGFEFQSYPSCSVRTLELAVEIVTELDRPDTGVVFDVFHFHAGGSSMASLRRLKAPRLFAFQTCDCENLPAAKLQAGQGRLLPGATGVIPLRKIWQELNGIGYDRVVTVEAPNSLYADRDPQEVATEAREALVRTLGPALSKKA